MTSFVNINYSTRHPGVERVQNFVEVILGASKQFSFAKGLSTMLLAAMVAALVVVADQLIETWADGHLLAAWVMLWLVGFAAIGLLASPTRQLALKSIAAMDAWSRKLARQRADERLWYFAKQDPRVMADLQAAINRARS